MSGICAVIVPLTAVAMNYDDIDEKHGRKRPYSRYSAACAVAYIF
jgi:hypothetical protein